MHFEEIRDPPGWDGNEGLLAIIIRASYQATGVTFFTGPDQPQQVAYMHRPAGTVIPAHTHTPYLRTVSRTQEVLLLRRGRLRIDFYNGRQERVSERMLEAGDVVILVHGGHGFEALEDVELYEVKQGPYDPARDKVRFGDG